ncbi:fatty acid hydroxylase [Pedobacter sp. HMF7647]|uniref:Fatty acid hydroxylase n=1 Tax=Hufsiella arboris TaxID=2695275 RepID=A0A7K1YEE6_9SPHI|nr:sterol desaturase family protein [Hufsiella arboris]MXV52965.1 fatty acid hydroxylase [Hufsiella arboris]
MEVLFNAAVVITTFVLMEAVSWAMHKYLFHGPLWFIHKTHHQKRHGWLELNDIFSVLFAAIAFLLMYSGHERLSYKFWIGVGISLYGISYFIFHDWFIHNRIRAFKSKNRYLSGVRRAHKIHHKSVERFPSEEFGLWIVSGKYLKKQPSK